MSLTRRRLLAISAASLVAGPADAAVNRLGFLALGARCSLTLPGPRDRAQAAMRAVRREVGRVERAFSLYDPASELSRLNRDGVLRDPSPIFVEGADIARQAARATAGSFDVTVQPIWRALAAGKVADYSTIGWQGLEITSSLVRFRRAGMAATFNGIAQGYAADRAVRVLGTAGYRDLLVDLGEYLGAGQRPDGGPWRIGVAHPVSGTIAAHLALENDAQAVATSAPRGTLVRGVPHIFDPLQRPGPRWASVTLRAATAAMADACSTAIAAAPRSETERLLTSVPVREAILIPEDGPPVRWRA